MGDGNPLQRQCVKSVMMREKENREGNCIKIGMADTVPLEDPGFYQSIYDRLSGIRRKKADDLKMFHARCQSVAAGWLITRFVREYAQGKTCISMAERKGEQNAKTDETVYYNLSHSGELAACAVAQFPVGIDIEQVRKCRMSVARRCFDECDCILLEQAEGKTEQAELFTKLWTIKESEAKLTGEGLARILRKEVSEEICTVSERIEKGEDIYYLTVAFSKRNRAQLTGQTLSISRIGYENV
ncbi:MAG: 4'-phosphopantetheinyl transferase superfamily protein [Lachnospiraceae bacterium]|nr:4'-phosphopantetheinyl transferase superfamily protein [Lachnospiraceae bacterium]